jgi:hypothetical protein
MEIQTPTSLDKLACFREQAAMEQAEKSARSKMSDAAKAKLRALNEHERIDEQADTRLVKEFNSRTWTVEQLTDLFAKSFGGSQPRRRAIKAFLCLKQGMKVYRIHDVSLLGELCPDEGEIPMSKFLARYPLPENEIVTPAEKPVRRCALGRKCSKAKNQRAAEVTGTGLYCSGICRSRVKAQTMRSKQRPAAA